MLNTAPYIEPLIGLLEFYTNNPASEVDHQAEYIPPSWTNSSRECYLVGCSFASKASIKDNTSSLNLVLSNRPERAALVRSARLFDRAPAPRVSPIHLPIALPRCPASLHFHYRIHNRFEHVPFRRPPSSVVILDSVQGPLP